MDFGFSAILTFSIYTIKTKLNMTFFKSTFALLLVLFTIQLSGQHYFGLRGGINIANVTTTEEGAITNGRIAGVKGALFFDIELNDLLALQPELTYIQKGFKRYFSETNDYVYKLNYVDVSALLKAGFEMKNEKINGYGIAGPYLGVSGNGKRKNLYDNEVQDLDYDSGVPLDRYDYGVLFGGGIEILSNIGALVVDLRYNLGLSGINKYDLADGNIHNHGIIISVGYAFLMGRGR